jgi:3-oxoacyl-[acyl-carrier protein] reductase
MIQGNSTRPVALVTGASRKIGIGAAIAQTLAQSGWDVATTYWRPYDDSMPWASQPNEAQDIIQQVGAYGSRGVGIEADLGDTSVPKKVFDQVESALGPVTALVMSHCHSVDSNILTTTIECFDQHFAINARATWLLVREFGRRYRGAFGDGRIIAITSDHTVENLPYGASKGAMDRIVLAAAQEFKDMGITANVINPGATDTGWMTEELMDHERMRTPLGRVGTPDDCANLVRFLCSKEGGWINGQLLFSNGGVAACSQLG